MARAVWSGSIGFGLVSIPVRLWGATVPRDVRFHQFDRASGRRIHYQRVAGEPPSSVREPFGPRPGAALRPSEEDLQYEEPRESGRAKGRPAPEFPPQRDVPFEEVVKGYEVAEGEYVLVTPEELAALRPERSRTIEIQDFVSQADIDPVYFDRTYLVAPQRGVGAEKPYGLLLRAMQRSERVGIGTFVLSSKAHLAAIRPREDLLVLETLFFADEVRSVSDIDYPLSVAEPAERELNVAIKLIDLLATEWDPTRYRDAYREQVLGLIESKAGTRVVREEEPAPPTAGVADLMAALQASVEAARKGPKHTGRKAGRRTG